PLCLSLTAVILLPSLSASVTSLSLRVLRVSLPSFLPFASGTSRSSRYLLPYLLASLCACLSTPLSPHQQKSYTPSSRHLHPEQVKSWASKSRSATSAISPSSTSKAAPQSAPVPTR